MIEATGLRKVYGAKTAVDGISFTVQPGKVTGFLGPNGAGKSTTMRMIMGLDRPTSGDVLVNGRHYSQHKAPLHEVGALLDAKAVHTSRSAYNHLRAMAATHGIPTARVEEVIEMTGLTAVAKKKAGGFSLGMGQRLGIANALLGDPQTLILDEPVNGLDPEGVQWVRNLARYLASQGKTIFISSHLMSEMAQTADHLIVIGRGKIIADTTVEALIESQSRKRTLVRTAETTRLSELLARDGVRVEQNERETLEVYGVEPLRIAELALDNRVLVYELTPLTSSLEEAYFQLTKDEVEYHSHITGGPAAPGGPPNGSPAGAGATSAATMEGIQS